MTREPTFWHHYLLAHPGHAVFAFNPAAGFGAAVCLMLIAYWSAVQIQSRCGDCAAVPARCRCVREHAGRR
jgi:hypothetical protein